MAVFVIADQALLHRCRPCDTQRMAVHAAFAKELAGLQNADHGFLALLGYDNNLDPAFLDIEDRICHIALRKDDLVLAKFKDGLPFAHLGEKLLRIKYCLVGIAWHVRFRSRDGTPTLPFRPPTSEVKVPQDGAFRSRDEPGSPALSNLAPSWKLACEIQAAEEHSAADH